MTSRARRIVLAMYGHTKAEVPPPSGKPWIFAVVDAVDSPAYPSRRVYAGASDLVWNPTPHACYEALDEPDPITADLPLSPIVGGNYGLPCA